jgi:Phage tail tube protein
MAYCPPKKIDSNITGLRYAKERCLGQLPASPTWFALEPNGYNDFGGSITTVARNPINPSRQRKKGTVTDLEASGGFTQDFTIGNSADLLQGFLFANARERGTTKSYVRGTALVTAVDGANDEYEFTNRRAVSAVATTPGTGYRVGDLLTYSAGAHVPHVFYVRSVNATGGVLSVAVDEGGLRAVDAAGALSLTGGSGSSAQVTVTWGDAMPAFAVGNIVLASGFSTAANNGLKNVDLYTSGVVGVAEDLIAEASPPTAASVQVVGHKFGVANLSITLNGSLARLTDAGTFVDFTTMGFLAGEWVYVDGFANNKGFARIGAISADYLEFDKTDWEPVAEAAAGVTVSLYYGTIFRNESDPSLIVRQSYQIERTLGQDEDGTMSEYLVGAVANEFTLNVAQADKVTVDMAFVAIDNEQRDGSQGVKTGARPTLAVEDAFNTSSDFSRIKLSVVDNAAANPTPLFAFATDLSLTINNSVASLKAIGNLGGFDTSAGTFEVGGSITAYFASIEAVRAVRNNADITLDFAMVKNNKGMLFDIPLLTLGNGRLAVEQDQSITIPLDTSAAESKFGNTLLVQVFPYLPNSAG